MTDRTAPLSVTHWTQAEAAKMTGRSKRTIQSWCAPAAWRPALLAPDAVVSAAARRPMYRIGDVVEAELASVRGRYKGRKHAPAARPERPKKLRGEPSYWDVHDLLRDMFGKAVEHDCVDCGEQAAHWSYDGSDPAELIDKENHPYSLDPDHYAPRCHGCHRRFDAAALRYGMR